MQVLFVSFQTDRFEEPFFVLYAYWYFKCIDNTLLALTAFI